MGELPGGEFAGGVFEAVGYGFVSGRRRYTGQGLAVEGVGGGGEVEVVGVAAAGDVDVGLGAGGGRVDPASGYVSGRTLDGVAGEGVGVVDADFGSTSGGAVVVENDRGSSMVPMPSKSARSESCCRSFGWGWRATTVPSAPFRT